MRYLLIFLLFLFTLKCYAQDVEIKDFAEKSKKFNSFGRLAIDASLFPLTKDIFGVGKVRMQNKDIDIFVDGNIKGNINGYIYNSTGWIEVSPKKAYFADASINLETKKCVYSLICREDGIVKELELCDISLDSFKNIPGSNNSNLLAYKTSLGYDLALTMDFKICVISISNYTFSFNTGYEFKQN